MPPIFASDLPKIRMDGLPMPVGRTINWGRAVSFARRAYVVYAFASTVNKGIQILNDPNLTEEQKQDAILQLAQTWINTRFKGQPPDQQKQWSGKGVAIGVGGALGFMPAVWKADP